MNDLETKKALQDIFENVGELIEKLQDMNVTLYVVGTTEGVNMDTQTEYQKKVFNLLNEIWDKIQASELANNSTLENFLFFLMSKRLFKATELNKLLGGDDALYQRLNSAINRYQDGGNFPQDLAEMIKEKIVNDYLF